MRLTFSILRKLFTTIVGLFQLMFIVVKEMIPYFIVCSIFLEITFPNANTVFDALKRKKEIETFTYGEEYSLISNYNLIQYIAYDDAFKSLSLSEEKEVIEAVVHCVAYRDNLPELNICYRWGKEGDEIAFYNHATRTITFNCYYIMSDEFSSEELLDTCLHETRHCYQHMMVDAYNRLTPEEQQLHAYDEVRQWRDNFINYIDSDDDEMGYYNQIVERDARTYAHYWSEVYIEDIYQIRANVEDELACKN